MRKQVAAVAVALLIALAGCSAGGGGGATTTQTTTAGTTTGTTQAGGDPVYETPLDGQTVVNAHKAVLADAGTFSLTSRTEQTQGDRSRSVNATAKVSYDSGEYLTRQTVSGRTVATYAFANGTAYQRFAMPSGDARYRKLPQATNASAFAAGSLDSFVDAFRFSYVGTQTVDGTETYVYEASGVEDLNQSAPGFENLNVENVTSVSATVYIAESGLVKQFSYELAVNVDGTETTVSVTQRYTNVGETTVRPPDWIDEARANTTSQ